jgi:hypothetical protein
MKLKLWQLRFVCLSNKDLIFICLFFIFFYSLLIVSKFDSRMTEVAKPSNVFMNDWTP